MTVRIDGTNSTANPAITGADTDTGLQLGTNEIQFVTGGTNRATVESGGGLTIEDGDLIIGTAGHGIDFSATTDGTGVSNLSEVLDDYEEGTWVPQWSRTDSTTANITAQPTTRMGSYTKIGNRVFFTCWFSGSLTTTETTEDLAVSGLPYVVNSSGNAISAVTIWNFSGFNVDRPAIRTSTGTDSLRCQQWGAALDFDHLSATHNVMFSGQYFV